MEVLDLSKEIEELEKLSIRFKELMEKVKESKHSDGLYSLQSLYSRNNLYSELLKKDSEMFNLHLKINRIKHNYVIDLKYELLLQNVPEIVIDKVFKDEDIKILENYKIDSKLCECINSYFNNESSLKILEIVEKNLKGEVCKV